jgi:transcriptional regulator with XRE-family HTH domain
LTQAALGQRVGASASTISRIERGHAKDVTLALLERIAVELGGTVVARLLWQGEAIDRLLDAEHARLVEWSVGWLAAAGWEAIPEVTFNVRGERGSIDVLARSHSGAVLLIEVKSVIPDIQALLAGIDRKARLAPNVCRDRGWPAARCARLLVVPADRTTRRRVAAVAATFSAALPARSAEVRRWVASPLGDLAGVLFVPNVSHTGARHRVGSSQRQEAGGGAGSV